MTDWFSNADYKIRDMWFHVPLLAAWAKKNLTITELPITELQARLETSDRLFVEVDEQEEWAQRCEQVSLDYPILVFEDGDKLDLIDGNHRTWKAWRLGLTTISAYVFKKMPDECDGRT
jgi:ParB-like chromosome segregation protein Spo0J